MNEVSAGLEKLILDGSVGGGGAITNKDHIDPNGRVEMSLQYMFGVIYKSKCMSRIPPR